jgi:hypothetical protein
MTDKVHEPSDSIVGCATLFNDTFSYILEILGCKLISQKSNFNLPLSCHNKYPYTVTREWVVDISQIFLTQLPF